MEPVPASSVFTFLVRLLILSVIWWALTLGDARGWLMAIGIVLLVTAVSMRLFPPSDYHLRPVALIRFFGFFLIRSVVAGVDVARRLLSPSLPVDPAEISVVVRLPAGGPRALLANVLSLMPGTLSVTLEGDRILVHCLDRQMPVEADLRNTEARIAAVFGIHLESGGDR
jgi:multicomponent Na+:H+ antiporter subunit E